ncbi:hypothetical protein LCGC14_0274280 [marine sediment metagenome]|uniref:Uncharacterized protein n=2 Tax=root TaxID=1 RepID=A0A9C9NCX0_9HYPH|nr:hypothetical protein [Aurantimonas coralicida]
MGLRFVRVGQGADAGLDEVVRAVMTFDDLYTAPGGESLNARQTPLKVGGRLDCIQFEAHPTFVFFYNRTDERSGQLVVMQAVGGLTEVPNDTDLSAVSVNCTIRGR